MRGKKTRATKCPRQVLTENGQDSRASELTSNTTEKHVEDETENDVCNASRFE